MSRINRLSNLDLEWFCHLLPVISQPDILVETQLLSRSGAQHNLVKLPHSPSLTLQLAEKPPILIMLMWEYAVLQMEKRCSVWGNPVIRKLNASIK